MGGFPDVRLEGVSHGEIVHWTRGGKGDTTTQALEAQLQQIVQLLHDSGEDVNKAVQRANAGEWQGGTADSAHGAMVTMRDYDDTMHGHSENTRYSAMGQSGESAATRQRIPDLAASPQGGQGPLLVDATESYKPQAAAKRSAEEQARQVMAEYRDATQSRVSALPAIPPVPKVVLHTGDDAAAPNTGGPSTSHTGSGTPDVPGGGSQATSSYGSTPGTTGGSHGSVPGGQHVSSPPPVQGTDPSSVVTPPAASAPTGNWPGGPTPGGTGPGNPNGPWTGAPGGPGGSAPYGTGGYGTPGRGGAGGYGGSGSAGGSGGTGSGAGESGQAGGRSGAGGQPGARSGAGMAAAEEAVARRGGVAGGGRAGGSGMGGMMGGGHGAEGDEDSEHTNKYGLPSDEHFDEDDEFLRDPRNRDFFVAPDVIGGPE